MKLYGGIDLHSNNSVINIIDEDAKDLAKTIFQVCGVNQAGKPIFNRQLRRNKLLEF